IAAAKDAVVFPRRAHQDPGKRQRRTVAMSVELRDVALGVKPGPLQEYLRSRGWQLNGGATESRRVASWAREGVVLEVPQRVDFADYSRRIAELLALLGELETRSPFALADDLIQPPGDVLGIRVDSEAARNGT